MLKFDRLKIVTSIEYISNIETNIFLTQSIGNRPLYYKYLQETPFYLLIMADISKQELVIEYTGKILLDDYPQLINRTNIRNCFETINRMGICCLDVENIMEKGEIWKCDVTQDITSNQLTEIVKQTKQSIANYDKWNCDRYETDGICIYNSVKTKRHKKRLIIYDKHKELSKATNQDFFNKVHDSEKMMDYFKDKIRFEVNINTKEQIRKLLDITDNRIKSVMNSTANPILKVYDEATTSKEFTIHHTNMKDYMRELVIKDCNYDLEAIEAKIRSLTPKNTSIKLKMQPFRELVSRMQNGNVHNYIRNLLV